MSDEIEKLLRKMPLRRPPKTLDRRVLRQPAGAARLWWAAGALAAAAVVVGVAIALSGGGKQHSHPEPGVAERTAQPEPQPAGPVRMEQTYSRMQYEGVLLLDDRTPLRKFRRRILRRVLWIDVRTGYTDVMSIPDEQVVLIAAETY